MKRTPMEMEIDAARSAAAAIVTAQLAAQGYSFEQAVNLAFRDGVIYGLKEALSAIGGSSPAQITEK